MKKTFLLLIFMLHALAAAAQLTENQKLESLAKVWGFLKYYHPEVAKGKRDWDAELMAKIPAVKHAKDQAQLSKIYLGWLAELGKVKECRRCDNAIPDSLARNLTLDWLYDAATFTPELVAQLDFVRKNRNQGKNHYVRYPYKIFKTQAEFPEKKYEQLEALPSEEFRLLGLFRYWNIINYFFPYKYATDTSWDSVLTNMLPKFRLADNPQAYHLAMLELSNSIDDGHNFFATSHTLGYFGAFYPPFKYIIVGDKIVVTEYLHQGFANADSVQVGDVITRIGGKPVSEALAEKLPYISGSNYAYKAHWAQHILLNGNEPQVTITLARNGIAHDRSIRRYAYGRFGYKPEANTQPSWQKLQPTIGYINMGTLERKEVNQAMDELQHTEALIIDMRKYPKYAIGAMAKRLLPDVYNNAIMPYPDLKYPGVFRPKHIYYGKRNNKNYYKGKVILLVNEGTMSAGEFGTMIFQLAPNATVIGRQTAGADGNITYIDFPGGFRASMSGLGVYYPDGRETQRIGIVPDITVKPTVAGIQNQEDEILNRALLFIQTGN